MDKRIFWEHYCYVERDIMGFEKGAACDWCGATEPPKVIIRNDDKRIEDDGD